ncbi:DMT family transporter [Streptomyces sp. NPDC059255]|uniref:EamA family transporter n=1 Tax=Streptomyces sp. NPDC059255 TaxID=3346793 RepID=UPI0036CECF40
MEESRTAAVGAAVPVPEAVAAGTAAGVAAGTAERVDGRTGAEGVGAVGSGAAAPGSRRQPLGPVALVVAGGLSVQVGAAVAVLLMPRTGAVGIVTLRLGLAALVMLAVCRPKLRGHSRTDWGTVVVFGATLAAMNGLFYQALERIPLGVAVTLEVLGPLALSVIVSRRLVNLLWAVLALGGVVLLSGGGFDRLDLLGVGYALGAGVMWATYIVFSARTGRRFPQADGLALAMAVGALLILPLGFLESGAKLLEPSTLGLALVVALMSSVLPYTLELIALRRMPAPTFSVLMSLEPGVAAACGFLILDQALSTLDALAIVLVIAASMGAVRTQVGVRARERTRSGAREGKALGKARRRGSGTPGE